MNRLANRVLKFAALAAVCGFAAEAVAEDWYVAVGGNDGAAGSSSAPFATIAHALVRAGGGDVIHLADGTYVESGLEVSADVTVIGDSGDRSAVVVDGNKTGRVFKLSSSGAVLSSLTVENGADSNQGANIYMSAGTVTNCVLRNGDAGYHGWGGNAYMAGGLLVDSQLIGGSEASACYTRSLHVVDGRVVRCDIGSIVATAGDNDSNCIFLQSNTAVMENCYVHDMTGKAAPAVFLGQAGTRPTLINCTIVNNAKGVAIHTYASPTVANCLICNNGGTVANELGSNNLKQYANCASTVDNDSATGWVKGTVLELMTAEDNPRPSYGLKTIDRGGAYDTDVYSATDLDGKPRVSHDVVDIGCFEHQFKEDGVVVAGGATAYATTVGAVITFNASASGGTEPYLYKWSFGYGEPVVVAGAETVHAYAQAGVYKVTVSASDDGGMSWSDPAFLPSVVNVAPPDLYVDATTGDDAANAPYDDPLKPAKSFRAAFSIMTTELSGGATVVEGVTLHVAPGTYEGAGFKVASGVRIVGEGPRENVVIDGGGNGRVFALSSKDAVVSGLTIRNGYCPDGGNVNISAGVVTNCVISDGECGYHCNGGNVYMSGGLLTDSKITGGGQLNNAYTFSVQVVAGRVVRCDISSATAKSAWDAVVLVGNDAMMENCVIHGFAGSMNAALNLGSPGTRPKVLNCTVADNVRGIAVQTYASPTVANTVMFGNGGTAASEWGNVNGQCFFNCASTVENASGTNWKVLPTTPSEVFKRGLEGDFTPAAGSALVDAGDVVRYEAVAGLAPARTKDLALNPRLCGKSVDIGCREAAGSAFKILLR